jgi:hypothetical protein
LKARRILDQMHHLEKVKRWRSPAGHSIDENIKIAVRSRIAARP